MPNTLASLWKWQPKFVGQKLYCDEIRHWCIAVKSARGDGRLVWLLPPVQPILNEDNV